MKKTLLGGIGFFLLVTLCFVALGIEAVPQNILRPASEDGVLDLSAVDFDQDIVMIYPSAFTHYPEQLLASGEEGTPGGSEVAPYGTYRLTLRLPAGGVYTMSQTANDMALVTMVDGQVLGTWGTVGASEEESDARAGTLVTSFSPDTDEVELSYQYSGFIRRYKPPSIYLGSAAQIAQQQERLVLRDTLFAACLFTAGLLFLGMFLFFGRKSQYVFFALFCLCLAADKLVTGVMPLTLLLPLSGASVARIEYLAVLGTMVCFALYVNAMFRGVFHKWARHIAVAIFILYAGCILLLPPYTFSGMRDVFLACRWAVDGYIVFMLLWKVRRPVPEQALVLAGALLFVAVNLAEKTVFRWVLSYRFGNGFLTACATVGVIFLNMVALSLAARRAERERDEARLRQRELDESNRMLDRLNQMKAELFTNLNHEMRTPLTVISVNAQVGKAMLEAGLGRETVTAKLDVVTQEAMRLGRLVNDAVELGGMQESRAGMERLALPPLLEKTGAVCELLVQKNGNRLALSVPRDLPPVVGSVDRLVQVVVNLLSNAAAHTQNGTIELAARAQDGIITVSVTDTGPGVPPDILPRVFERHVRGEAGGAGLGLPICKEIIEAHGGEITLENRLEGGCVVRFTLPVAEADADKEAGA